MKVKQYFVYLMISAGLFLGACKAEKEASASSGGDIPVISTKPMIKGGEEARYVPNATVFKMNGDYQNNVAIMLNRDGTLAYYPDPVDITSVSAPVPLGNGWYLNRQGIGPEAKFIGYTFEEYKALKKAPSQQQLIEAIIPGATVTEFKELPVSTSEAMANPQICLQYLP